MPITGEHIGNVNVQVFETSDGETLVYIEGNNRRVVPILDYLETSLEKY